MAAYLRDHTRFTVNIPASLATSDSKQKELMVRDLSVRGAGVSSNYPLQVNDIVTFSISADYFLNEPLNRKAKVTWCQKADNKRWRAGLDFGVNNKIDLSLLQAHKIFIN